MQQDVNQKLRTMYEEYQTVLRLIAKNRGVPVDDLDDVIQETYLAYYLNYSLDWNEKQKKAMLVKILRNKCVDWYRRNYQFDTVSTDAEETFDQTVIVEEKTVKDVLDRLIDDETKSEIGQEIYNMKKPWRDVIILYFLEEVSLILNVSIPALRMRISRIRAYLRELFQ